MIKQQVTVGRTTKIIALLILSSVVVFGLVQLYIKMTTYGPYY